MTDQRLIRNCRFIRRSLCWFAASFVDQNVLLDTGDVPCRGQPCQKQPSRKMATLAFGKTKSGRTLSDFERPLDAICFGKAMLMCRRQPVIEWRRNSRIKANSVDSLPRARMRAITADLLALENISVMRVFADSAQGCIAVTHDRL
jgi:hypothetical protein